MKTPEASQQKSQRKTTNAPETKHLSPCEILLEQAQICCHQAREAARLSRRQAARGLLCTARELLHRAASPRLEAEGWGPASCKARAQALPDGCLSLRLCLADGAEPGSARREALLRALESRTGSRWRWAGDILAVEKEAPHRVVVLRGAALDAWRRWCGSCPTHECELSLEIFATMNTTEASTNLQSMTSEATLASAPIRWNDWFHFDEEQQKCVFRSASAPANAATLADALANVQAGQA